MDMDTAPVSGIGASAVAVSVAVVVAGVGATISASGALGVHRAFLRQRSKLHMSSRTNTPAMDIPAITPSSSFNLSSTPPEGDDDDEGDGDGDGDGSPGHGTANGGPHKLGFPEK